MITDIVVSGCSFTHDYKNKTWPRFLIEHFPQAKLHDLSFPGAGNQYISQSMIRYLSTENLKPETTLVLIMWSGITRQDLMVTKTFYDTIPPSSKVNMYNDYWVFNGGILGAWRQLTSLTSSLLTPLFENFYKIVDNNSLAKTTLMHMVQTKEFLENRGYAYKFMSYVNYWKHTNDFVGDPGHEDFSLTYYAENDPWFKNLGSHWIWADDSKNCLYEYAVQHNEIAADKFHPTQAGQEKFTTEILLPQLKEFL
jgi:hypothetical protein